MPTTKLRHFDSMAFMYDFIKKVTAYRPRPVTVSEERPCEREENKSESVVSVRGLQPLVGV